MKISIIIPVYNVSEYVVECLDSVAIQDYSDIECIIVEDCSTDDSMRIVKEWLASYVGNVNFRLICHDRNKGLSAARNTGMRNMTGDYILFLDSDDYLLPNAVSILAEGAEKYPGIEYVVSSCDCSNDLFVNLWQITDTDKGYWDTPKDIQRITTKNPNVWNKLYRCSFLMENGLEFDETLRMFEDLVFNSLVYRKLKRIFCIQRSTYYYRIRPNSIMTSTIHGEKKVRNYVNIFNRIIVNEENNKYNYMRYVIIKEMRYLLYGRKSNPKLFVWKDFDILTRRFLLIELKHLRFQNAIILACFLNPLYKFLR